jgi:tetratricopeptide (TPR) repeat protein
MTVKTMNALKSSHVRPKMIPANDISCNDISGKNDSEDILKESDTEADQVVQDDSAMALKIDELYQRITEQLSVEMARQSQPSKSSAKSEYLSLSNISIKDCNFDVRSVQNEPTLIDVLEAWKNLVSILRKEMVFTQYFANLERAFRSVSATTVLYGRFIHILLDLLAQAALVHSRDRSIECRFVTLLEVVLSYDNPRWEPSSDICAIWIRLLQRIPPNIAPVNFRRKAYRVLVSLSWVPSSKGLLAACSFDESKQIPTFQKKGIIAHMSKIRGGPIPRYDSVNQLLDRLKDETDVCVAITSEREGMGKTTLAGQVASHPSILRVFTVLWLDIKQDAFTYARYITYLSDLCTQLGSPTLTWPTSVQRFEEPAIRKLREMGYMKDAKSLMSDFAAKLDCNILLVLDDVRDSTILSWFRFSDQQSIIVTTPHTNLIGVDWTLDLLPLSEEESAELFLKESGLSPNHILGKTKEVRSIVRHCKCHPLTVRTISRWYFLKQITAGLVHAIDEILADLNALAELESNSGHHDTLSNDPNEFIFDILSLMMGPIRIKEPEIQSVLFVLCFAAMVVVFGDVAPLDAIILLWEQVLRKEVLATDELGGSTTQDEISRYVWLVAEGLTHMGVIAIEDVDGWYVVQVHHNIYNDFGILIAKEMEVKETFQRTTSDWHKFFVTGYLSRKSQGLEESHDNTWKYTMEKLPSHILDGQMISTAKIVLIQEQFFHARIEALGWERAIDVQIRDCVRLQHNIENGLDSGEPEIMASRVFKRTAALVKDAKVGLFGRNDVERCEAIANALFLIGFALTENGYFQDALEYMAMAGAIPQTSKVLLTKVVYGACWGLLAESQTDEALQKIEEYNAFPTSLENQWLNIEMIQLKAAILIGSGNFQSADVLLQDFFSMLNENEDKNAIEIGMTLDKLGRLQLVMGDYDLALDSLSKSVSKKLQIGEESRAFSSTINVLGDIYVLLGSMNEAKEKYKSSLTMLKALHHDQNHLDWRFITGKLQLMEGDIASCLESFELVRRTSNSAPLKVYDQSAYDLRFIARVYDELGDTTESISVLKECLLLTEDRPWSLERAWGMIELAHCHTKMGCDNEAIRCFEQALEIQKNSLGTSKQVIETQTLIGSAYLSVGSVDEAISVFQANYETIGMVMPDDVEHSAGVLYLLADCYAAKSCYADATDCLTTCLEMLKRDKSYHPCDVAKILQRLGSMSMQQNEYSKAFEFLTETLVLRREHFDEAFLAETLSSLGVACRLQHDYAQSEKYTLEALDICKKEDDIELTGKLILELGYIYRIQLQAEKAKELYDDFIESFKSDGLLRGDILFGIGHVQFFQGDYEGAIVSYEASRKLKVSAHGCIDLRIARTLRCLGLASFFCGNEDISLFHLGEFTHLCDKHLSSDNVDFLVVQLLLGGIYFDKNDFENADHAWNRSSEVCAQIEVSGTTTPPWLISMIRSRAINRSLLELELQKMILIEE